ncbi:MAG TPA: bifunctional UDP-N-acetylglucosamine diphosphorylase/glucosamine-1-phosphate N-acetyltransferase GlmU [Rhodocyclaceae bacterium]|nr:bifunctional UDP-N-acetylglucosamine diphosphorylase/glucosamine-1-phosphate N-acetyltransferase GlmU [Rhodocyclaceae bacterium]
MNKLNVVILAAGQGKRMRSNLPKVLHGLADRPLLGHVIATARSLKPSHICVVYGHGGDQVRAAFAADADLKWAEQKEQLGTGHAVLQALPQIDASLPTLVLYGDVPLTRAATLQWLVHLAGPNLALLTANLPDPSGYGRIVREGMQMKGKVLRIVEQKDANDAEKAICEINSGIMLAPAGALQRWLPALGNSNAQGEYYLTDIVALAVAEGMEIATAQPLDSWEIDGVNSKAQLAALERIHQRNLAQVLLDEGVTLADPARIDIRGSLKCGRDVFIDVNTVFEGEVEIGDGTHISANCVIRNTKVGANVVIHPFTLTDDAIIGDESLIGPYARLRPGAALGKDVHIGNFVEVKNARIADHSKANHHAYLGDATIGSRVNVGAGTIICNYDGANKHHTVIEDDVFIGSDTQLVAPVTVRKGATIAAGTTLTKEAPEGQLTLSRAKQTSVSGWVRPAKKK